ncbi:TetR/AcrR family transcriptional regulator [Streptomyces sp. NPDC001941]|uniref:TetR/AcrR family transcriptional regulator n=1 Tax=Streptomyces sp. NPDC001941 TaxID=3154659 RepID=UPI0033269A66
MATTRREKAAETEAALKAAARRVFAERGYLNTKISDITAAAGRATGSFYNHFSGKEELLEALLRDLLAVADEAVAGVEGHDSDFRRIEAVRWHVEVYWRFYKTHLAEMTAVRQAAMADPDLGRRLQRILADDARHLAGHLAELPGSRSSPELRLSAYYALLDGFAHTWLVVNPADGLTITDEQAVDVLTDLLHHGLAGVPPTG